MSLLEQVLFLKRAWKAGFTGFDGKRKESPKAGGLVYAPC